MKTCSKCKQSKVLTEFTKNLRSSDGRGSWCYACNRLYQNARNRTDAAKRTKQAWWKATRSERRAYARSYSRARKEFIDRLKGQPCVDCGGTFPSYCMDFDHVRGSKAESVSQMQSESYITILMEIAKCELVCANCHRIRTDSRGLPSQNTWRRKFKGWVDALKSLPCTDCRRIYPVAAMEFDHTLGTKIAPVSKMWSKRRALAEIAKCDLVCANCHRHRTQVRRRGAA